MPTPLQKAMRIPLLYTFAMFEDTGPADNRNYLSARKRDCRIIENERGENEKDSDWRLVCSLMKHWFPNTIKMFLKQEPKVPKKPFKSATEKMEARLDQLENAVQWTRESLEDEGYVTGRSKDYWTISNRGRQFLHKTILDLQSIRLKRDKSLDIITEKGLNGQSNLETLVEESWDNFNPRVLSKCDGRDSLLVTAFELLPLNRLGFVLVKSEASLRPIISEWLSVKFDLD